MIDPGTIASKLDKSGFSYKNFLQNVASGSEAKHEGFFSMLQLADTGRTTQGLINIMCDDNQPEKPHSIARTL